MRGDDPLGWIRHARGSGAFGEQFRHEPVRLRDPLDLERGPLDGHLDALEPFWMPSSICAGRGRSRRISRNRATNRSDATNPTVAQTMTIAWKAMKSCMVVSDVWARSSLRTQFVRSSARIRQTHSTRLSSRSADPLHDQLDRAFRATRTPCMACRAADALQPFDPDARGSRPGDTS